MFLERQQHPTIEFNAEAGQQSPTLVHYLSDRADPFKSVLPLLIEGAGQDQERVFVITSPLSELIDETLRLYQHPDVIDQVLIDRIHQPFFEAVKAALIEAAAKIDRIQFAAIEDEEESA
ncbi:hypothetical protein [Massilia varians]|uniref:hypothetical protein n=1 Tax=Massilia varians TaxID=457921 RepID=UPI0025551C6D|nr:hypothetical protein [Massilia varians]MDK6075569.1 hypothetical protein [Massilia varians]